MSSATKKWVLDRSFKRSGRLWRNNENGQYYLADHSGDRYPAHPCWMGRPDETDDGPLRLDVERSIVQSENFVLVYVIDDSGDRHSVTVDMGAALYLSERFDIPIRTAEGFTYGVHVHRPCPEDLRD